MDDRFVTLASLVASAAQPTLPIVTPESKKTPPVSYTSEVFTAAAPVQRPMLDLARADLAQELALMRMAALEAFERASSDLLALLAHDVLGRELALAPADLAVLAARALATFAEAEPIGLVVAPGDLAAFETSLPVRADASLDAGDLVVEVADGAFESRYALRVRETVASIAEQCAR